MAQTAEAYVVDASVAAKWFLRDEVLSDQAIELWRRQNDRQCVLLAPSHLYVEVSNAVLSAIRHNPPRLTIEEGRQILEEFLRLRIQIVQASELIVRAFELAIEHEVSLYDALYLGLTSRIDVPLVTADANFYRKMAGRPSVLWLGDLDT